MSHLHFPWLEFAIAVLLLGAAGIRWVRRAELARIGALGTLALSLLATAGAWLDLEWSQTFAAHDRWDLLRSIFGKDLLFVDEVSAPLLTLISLLGFLTVLATLRTKVQRLPFSGLLLTQAIWQALLSSEEPWLLIGLMGISIIPLWLELKSRNRPVRVFLVHMLAHILLLVVGWGLITGSPADGMVRSIGFGCLVISLLIRGGVCPFHCWVTDLFEHASFAGALLFVAPMASAYLGVRLLLPTGPGWSLQLVTLAAVLCAMYSAGMAWVQQEPRRYFSFLFLSHSALVLVGLETVSTEALTGGLCVWFAASLSLAGFGLTLRAVESRLGRLSLADFHGLYDHMPNLAALFLITGLASVGFPGTIGFVSTELLVDGIIHEYPWMGLGVVLASVLNGISILRVYFRIFAGTRHTSTISLQSRWPERIAVLTLVLLMIGGGIFPQPFLLTRLDAAQRLIHARQASLPIAAPIERVEPTEERGAEESPHLIDGVLTLDRVSTGTVGPQPKQVILQNRQRRGPPDRAPRKVRYRESESDD